MKTSDVLKLVKSHANERGMEHWRSLENSSALKSYGLGLTQLRKLGKELGRDRQLAGELWDSEVYDLKVLSLLIDDPKLMTPEQAEQQVAQLQGGMLAHVFSSCDATLAKTTFVVPLADKWIKSGDAVRRRCGYGLLYEISKFSASKAPQDAYFIDHIKLIGSTFRKATGAEQMAMGAALMGIGKRNAALNAEAVKLARTIGPVQQDNGCEPFDVEKHLTSAQLKRKLGI